MVAVRTYTDVELVGVVVQWSAAVLLLVLFHQLAGLGTQRRLLATWRSAWLALMISLTGFLVAPFASAFGIASPPLGLAALVYSGGKFGFLALVTLGAVQAVGRPLRVSIETSVAVLAIGVGVALTALFGLGVTMRVQVVVTPIFFIGAAVLVLRSAVGPRAPGLRRLAVALVVHGVLWAIYFAGIFFRSSLGAAAVVLDPIARASGYGDAIVASILGASIVLLLVQDSFLEVAQARSQRVRDLGASEARLMGIIEAVQEAIVTVDTEGRIDLSNAAAERLFSLSSRGALGMPLEDLVLTPGSTLAGALDDAVTVHFGGPRLGPSTLRGEGRRLDGSTFPLEFSVGALRVENRPGSVVVLRDLTAGLAMEAEREQFERRVAESEKMMAIGRVVSGVAHELNNPLAVVLGQSEQLLDAVRDDADRTALQLIHQQAHRARHIVKDLLAFVRQREEPREAVDLSQLAEHVAASQVSRLNDDGVTLQTELTSPMPPVLADRLGIEQVVINLLDNACDAAGAGGIVRLVVRVHADCGELIVEDSGDGVPDTVVSRIFEPFFTTKPFGRGTGLGLPVSLGVVEQHAGTLRLENRPAPGVGARFVLTLPLDPTAAVRSPATGVAPRSATLPPPVRLDGERLADVLLIDDESAVRATLARVFQRGGWPVREAASGEEGLAWLLAAADADLPALILCDLKMPGMGGREVHAHLLARRPQVLDRLVFVTGDVVESTTAAFIAGAGCEVVEKPFTVAEIARAVERVLGRRGV